MEIILNDKNGVVLHTSKKYCQEDIKVKIDDNIILDTTDATATATDIMLNKTAYVNGEKITGTANPIETTITPSATQQIKSGLFNKVTVTGDSNLIAENIKKDVSIFGVVGSLEEIDEPNEETDYTELEYIESTGEQYIDTGIIPTNHKVEIKFEMLSSANNKTIFGTNTYMRFQLSWFNNEWHYSSGNGGIYSAPWDGIQEIVFNNENKKIVRNGTEVAETSGTCEVTDSLYIFRRGIQGDTENCVARIYYFKVYDRVTNELVRDFIPVKMKDTGEVGLYDKVEEKFYQNKGTGTFVAGPEQLAGNATIKNLTNSTTFKVSNWLTTISKLNLTGITSMEGAFTNCANLLEIPEEMDTSSVTTMASAFSFCSSLPEIKNLNTENVRYMTSTFNNCTKLTKLPQLRADKVTTIYNTFNECNSLSDFGGLLNIGKSFYNTITNAYYHTLTFTGANNLTHDSLMNIINGLYDLNLTYNVAGGGTLYTQKLMLGSTNLAKLTADEIAIATNKGWTVS